MSIQLSIKESCFKEDKLEKRQVHYMPCKINYDGPTNFSKYIHVDDDNNEKNKGLTASFHGRPLMGTDVEVPKGYVGLVLEKSKNYDTSDDKKVFATLGFDSFVYWNWDKVPNKNDIFIKALDWIDIAEVLHTPESME